MSLMNAFEGLATEAMQRKLLAAVMDDKAQDADYTLGNYVTEPAPRNGDEPVTVVTLHPDFPLPIDPSQVFPVGGRTKGGSLLAQLADQNGAQILSDSPQQLTGQAYNLAGGSQLVYVDTQGYQSISVQLRGTWVGTVSFYCSNDSSNWDLVGGYASTGSAAPVSSATANATLLFPTAFGRYFKAILTAYTSGVVIGTAWLRNTPLPTQLATPTVSAAISGNPASNTAQIAGTATVTAGVAGLQAIGGNVAAAVAPTSNPVPVAGWDGKLTRRLLLDPSGGITSDPMMLPTNAVTVRQNLSTANNESGVTEALNQILRELQYLNFVVKQLPWHLNTGVALPDDEELFKNDPQLTIK